MQRVRPEQLGQPPVQPDVDSWLDLRPRGVGGQDRGPCTRLCRPRRAKGPCDSAPAPHPHCQPRGWAAGRWPTKGILCPGRMTPLCGWRVAGSHDGFLPSQLPARSPLGGRAPTWGPAAPARALLSRPGPPRGSLASLWQSEPRSLPAALAWPAGPSWARPGPLLLLLQDLRCWQAAGSGGDLTVGGWGSVAPTRAVLACSCAPAVSAPWGLSAPHWEPLPPSLHSHASLQLGRWAQPARLAGPRPGFWWP